MATGRSQEGETLRRRRGSLILVRHRVARLLFRIMKELWQDGVSDFKGAF